MKKLYVLRQKEFGAIAFNEDEAIIEAMYEAETQNGKYAGFSIKEATIPENIFKLEMVEFWNYLTKVTQ